MIVKSSNINSESNVESNDRIAVNVSTPIKIECVALRKDPSSEK